MKNFDLEKTMAIAESLGWIVFSKNDSPVAEHTFIQVSPLGEGFQFSVSCDADHITDEIRKYAESFDPDEHARMWITSTTNGVPGSVRDIIDNAEAIKAMLMELAVAIAAEPGEGGFYDNFAKVVWSIDDVIGTAKEAGVTLTKDQAAAWWLKNQQWFKDQLTQTGNDMLAAVNWAEEGL